MKNGHTNENKLNGHALTRPVVPSVPFAPVLTNPPGTLLSSQQTLSFEQADANRPSFRVVAVSQRPANRPLTLTTDAPDHFHLATDGSPRFLPGITLTPSTNPTYIHVRYLATETGQHTGQLTIANGQETITVGLTGQHRGRGLIGAGRSFTSRPLPGRLRAVKSGLIWLSVPLLAAVAYTVFSNWHQSVAPPVVGAPAPVGVSVPRPDPVRPEKPTAISPKKQLTVGRIRKRQTRTPDVAELNAPVTPPAEEFRLSGPERQSKPVTTVVRQDSTEAKKPARPRNDGQTEKTVSRPSVPVPPAAESELERVLNQPQ